MRLTADSASCNHDFCCCPRRSVLENPVTQKQPKECVTKYKVNLPKLRHYNTFGSERLKMARESDFNWEDDLMTKWVIFYEVIVREFWRKWDGGRVRFICITLRHAQMKNIKRIANAVQYNIILLFSFSIILIALSVAKVIIWSHWQCNFLITRLDDLFCRYCPVTPLYTGATRGKSPTWLDWPSLTGQIMENRNPGRSRKNGASPIRLIIRRLLWMISKGKNPFRHERAYDDFVVLWLHINQKEVIKECVYMCQMVAQFGTR